MGTVRTRIDMTGNRCGRLTVIGYECTKEDGHAMWKCICDCGKEVIVDGRSLRSGNTKSCGCYNRERSTARIVALNRTHGWTNTRLFRIWGQIINRCKNQNASNFCDYGGRNISVCQEWATSFEAFRNWALSAGYADNLSIDRKNNEKGYCPENCRWATAKEQANNRRSNTVINFNGETHTVSEWADITGVKYEALLKRLSSKTYTIERALTEPMNERGKYARRNL